jgi:hypothetical protein
MSDLSGAVWTGLELDLVFNHEFNPTSEPSCPARNGSSRACRLRRLFVAIFIFSSIIFDIEIPVAHVATLSLSISTNEINNGVLQASVDETTMMLGSVG